jgi:hypothetical protein
MAEEIPPERQFDFWLGEWDVTWGEGERGTNRIESILDGRVIQENFDGNPAMPFKGMSLSVYVARLGQWLQTWVDNEGNYWHFSGAFKDGRMVLSTEDVIEGKKVHLRMVFYNITADRLDWKWQRSVDDGQTWKTIWEIIYKRKSSDQTKTGQDTHS